MMMARSLLSLFFMDDDNVWLDFLYAVTEPVIYPIRALFDKLDLFKDSPLDIPFFVTTLMIIVVQVFLPA